MRQTLTLWPVGLALLRSAPAFRAVRTLGPATWVNAPRCLHQIGSGAARPGRWDVAGSSGKPAFVPLAMPRQDNETRAEEAK
jgi:hypothetical protein